jgi:hypothetical protein
VPPLPQLRLSAAQLRTLRKPRADVRVRRKMKAALNAQLAAEVSGAIQVFELSLAPSVNRLYANVRGKGRVKTKHYRQWIKTALGELVCQRAKPAQTPVSISILLPNMMIGDADGRIKAVADLAVRAGIIPDDRREYVNSVSITFGECENMRVTIAPNGVGM